MKVVVTGGAGFIASHIVDAYIAAGHQVLIIDHFGERGGASHGNVHPRATLYKLDIRSLDAFNLIAYEKPDVVNLHAAQHSVKHSTENPVLDADVNIIGLINMLDACVAAGTRKVIFASSAATYGEAAQIPIDESTPQNPLSPYAITKLAGEHYVRYYAREKNLAFTIFRYGNVFGPRQNPDGEAGVICIFAKRFFARQDVRVDGDGEQCRDYVYVSDVAQANVLALSAGDDDVFCIASGRGTSVHAIYRALCQVSGFEANIVRAPKRPGDIYKSVFSVTKAEKVLGWKPQVDFDEGIRLTYRSFT